MAAQTKAERYRDAIWERIKELNEQDLYRARGRAKGPLVARMDEVQARGVYDRDEDGFNRTYRGPVRDGSGGVEPMTAQVVTLGPDMVIGVWSAVRDHHRRFLVVGGSAERDGDLDSAPTYWMETETRAVQVGPRNKYYDSIKRIVCLHLHYADLRHDEDTISLTQAGMEMTAQGEAAARPSDTLRKAA